MAPEKSSTRTWVARIDHTGLCIASCDHQCTMFTASLVVRAAYAKQTIEFDEPLVGPKETVVPGHKETASPF